MSRVRLAHELPIEAPRTAWLDSIIKGDCVAALERLPDHSVDVIFADPPYALTNITDIPRIIFEKDLLKEDGLFVLEHGKDNNFEEDPHFLERRVYGSVNFSIFSKAKD